MKVKYNKFSVAYFVSDLYAEPCGVSICSLFESNKGFEDIVVFIIEDNISSENKARINNLGKAYRRRIFFPFRMRIT